MIYKIAIISVLLLAWFGFAGPFCMSSDSTVLCIAWPLCTLGWVCWVLTKLIATTNKGEKK